jgi:hypothetical protein
MEPFAYLFKPYKLLRKPFNEAQAKKVRTGVLPPLGGCFQKPFRNIEANVAGLDSARLF